MIGAAEILASKAWTETYDQLRQKLLSEFERTSASQTAVLQLINVRLAALNDVRAELERRLSTREGRTKINKVK